MKRDELLVHNKQPLKALCYRLLTTSSRISSVYALLDSKFFAYSLLDLAGLKAAKEFIFEANLEEFSSSSKVK